MADDRFQVVAEGRLGTDVRSTELRFGDRAGERITHARAVCNLPTTGGAAKGGPTPMWVRLVASGTVGEALGRHAKGDRVVFEGALRWNTYQRRDGEDGSGYECELTSIEKEDAGDAGATGGETAESSAGGKPLDIDIEGIVDRAFDTELPRPPPREARDGDA